MGKLIRDQRSQILSSDYEWYFVVSSDQGEMTKPPADIQEKTQPSVSTDDSTVLSE